MLSWMLTEWVLAHVGVNVGGPEGEARARSTFLAAIDAQSSMPEDDRAELHTEYVDFEHDRGGDPCVLRAAEVRPSLSLALSLALSRSLSFSLALYYIIYIYIYYITRTH